MSHFLATAGTYDYAYYQADCKKLAINNPGFAANNADSHEFIAENTPSLSCATGVSIIFSLFLHVFVNLFSHTSIHFPLYLSSHHIHVLEWTSRSQSKLISIQKRLHGL